MMKRQLIVSAAAFLLRDTLRAETLRESDVSCLHYRHLVRLVFLHRWHILGSRKGAGDMLGVALLAWVVNFLLLWAVGKFLNANLRPVKALLAALLGAVAVAASLLPGIAFFHAHWSRGLVLVLMCVTAFGVQRKFLWQLGLFALLHFSVGGLAAQTAEPLRMTLGAVGISLACLLARDQKHLVPVELSYGQTHLQLTALYDTGNQLVDPVTGQGVLILDAPSAQKLTGLTAQQLNTPVESITDLPGLRLIPYHTVGSSGFLLALRLPQVKIDNRQESVVVAFAPKSFGKDYQALTGGSV